MKNIEKLQNNTFISYFDAIAKSPLGAINQQEYLENINNVLQGNDFDAIASMYTTTYLLVKNSVRLSSEMILKVTEIFDHTYIENLFTQMAQTNLSQYNFSQDFYKIIRNTLKEEKFVYLVKKSYINNKWTLPEIERLQFSKRVKAILEFDQCYENGRFQEGIEIYNNVLLKQGYHPVVQEGIDITKLNILRKILKNAPQKRPEFDQLAEELEGGSLNAHFESKLNQAYVHMETGNGEVAEKLFKELIIMKAENDIEGRKDKLYSGMILNYFKNGFGERSFLQRCYQKLKYFASKYKCSNKTHEVIHRYEKAFG